VFGGALTALGLQKTSVFRKNSVDIRNDVLRKGSPLMRHSLYPSHYHCDSNPYRYIHSYSYADAMHGEMFTHAEAATYAAASPVGSLDD
jgi:hypothetical protein